MSLYGETQLPEDDRPTVQVTGLTWPMGDTAPVGRPVLHASTTPVGLPPGRGRRRALIAAGTAVAVLAALGGTASYAYAGEVPRGTEVLGVDLGGKSRAAATALLRDELDRRDAQLRAPVSVQVADQSGKLDPAEVGLAVDVPATVSAAANTRVDPFSRLFGSRNIKPVVVVDMARLDAKLRRLFSSSSRKMTMPDITFTGTTPKPVYPKPGLTLAPEKSARALQDGWLSGQPVTIPLVEQHPTTTAEEVDRLVAELAKPAVSAPIRVITDAGTITLSAQAIANSLTFATDAAGKLSPRFDDRKLRKAISSQLAPIEIEPKDAKVAIVGGKPKITAGSDGRKLDTVALGSALLAVLPATTNREVKGALSVVKPETTTEEVAKLGIKEKVSTFTTRFPGGLSSPRSQNIITVAKDVDGTVVKPGKTFSLNGHTGDRTVAKGYQEAPVILEGKLVPGVGGGVSQFTTTLFNAIYYAGLQDVEHKPHSYWFSRYPPVIESTIFYPDLDFKFRNNTQYGVVIDTAYTSDSVTVAIWSTRIYDSVKTEYSPRRNITKPKTIYLTPGPKCIATNGIDGFTQDAWRVIRKDGREIKREKFTWTYDAEPRYVCGEDPAG